MKRQGWEFWFAVGGIIVSASTAFAVLSAKTSELEARLDKQRESLQKINVIDNRLSKIEGMVEYIYYKEGGK